MDDDTPDPVYGGAELEQVRASPTRRLLFD